MKWFQPHACSTSLISVTQSTFIKPKEKNWGKTGFVKITWFTENWFSHSEELMIIILVKGSDIYTPAKCTTLGTNVGIIWENVKSASMMTCCNY